MTHGGFNYNAYLLILSRAAASRVTSPLIGLEFDQELRLTTTRPDQHARRWEPS